MAFTQAQIDALIQFIDETEDPHSVTNVIVATILAYIADKIKETATNAALSSETIDRIDADTALAAQIQSETTERQSADAALSTRIIQLQNALNELMDGDATAAIESFQEVIAFLSGVTDDEKLTGLLNRINNRLTSVETSLSYKASLDRDTGKLDYSLAPTVMLDSMGRALDNANNPGVPVAYVAVVGDTVFNPSTGEIVFYETSQEPVKRDPDARLLYGNKNTGYLYQWKNKRMEQVGGGSGEGGATSVAVKRNVNALQAKVDELIGLLANSAFSTSRPAPIGTLDWGDDTPVETYYNVSGISASHAMYSVTNAATRVLAGISYNNVITAKAGYDLLGVTVNGVAQTVNNDSCTINIANVQGDIAIVVSAQAESVTPTITHTVQATLTDLNLQPYGGTVNDGDTFTATLELAIGVTGKRLPTLSEITINGSHGTASLTNGVLTIPNITSDIAIIAAAVATSGVTHSVTYNLSGVTKTSGATEVEDGQPLTVVLSKDSSFNGYYTSKAVHFGARDVIVYMNGQVVSGVVNQNGLDNDVTIAIPQVTGDVVIMNEVWLAGYVDYEGNVHSSTRSVYSSVLIPIPSGCTELTIKHLYQNSSNWGCAFYNYNGKYVSGVKFDKADDGQSVTIPENVTHIKLSLYDYSGYYEISNMYIKDVTHNVYIWKGDNVQ